MAPNMIFSKVWSLSKLKTKQKHLFVLRENAATPYSSFCLKDLGEKEEMSSPPLQLSPCRNTISRFTTLEECLRKYLPL